MHPELVATVVSCLYCYTSIDFTVIWGMRTLEQQIGLIEKGFSWTRNSKHLIQADGYAHAVDLQPLRNNRAATDWDAFQTLSAYMFLAANHLGIKIAWGGSWPQKDGYHFELIAR